jgi:8-oxo-dGTP pyrophosphatase MutT (NUDIX family)
MAPSMLGIPKSVGAEFVAADVTNGHAAGILFVAPDGDVLLLRRSSTEENYGGHWALPGGKADDGETPEQTADREAREEMGDVPAGAKKLLDSRVTPSGMAFHTFAQPTDEKFVPTLNFEHSGYAWAPFDQLPRPMHPAVQSTLKDRLGLENYTRDAGKLAGQNFAKWAREPERSPIEDRLERLQERRTSAMDAIALDRSTVRRIDQDGHLFVEMTPISKANICPYYGREIPDYDKLGLDPEKTYRLYRDADELAKAAASFAGKPLMLCHIPVSADEHPREDVVGAVGDEVEFNAPYLMAPLSIWDGEAIALINSGEQKELSSAYRYRADMTPGTFQGESYDGVMRDISGNHVALVKEGRAGPDVVVGDSKQEISMKTTVLSRKAVLALGALTVHLKPKLAQDAKIDLVPVLTGITGKNFKAKRGDILSGITRALTGKLAQDANLDDLVGLLDTLDDVTPAEDMEPNAGVPQGKAKDEEPKSGLRDFLKGKLSAEDMAACDEMLDDQEAMDEADKDDDEDKKRAAAAKDKGAKDEEKKDMVTKEAMDSAISNAVKVAQDEMQRTQREIREAEEAVRPYVGKLAMAHDSAAGVYRTALGALGVKNVDTLHVDALKPILQAQPLPGATPRSATVAMDAAGVSSFHEMFPAAKSHVVKTL